MHEQRFFNEVHIPFIDFLGRSSENVCIDKNYSDVVSLAKQASLAAYHFHEAINRENGVTSVPAMSKQCAEVFRQQLSDVVDTAKHGVLRDKDRQIILKGSLAFEFNEDDKFRFIRTEILAKNTRFGEFLLNDTLLNYFIALGIEHRINLSTEVQLPKYKFKDQIEIFTTPKSGIDVKSISLRTYQRNSYGQLTLADPPNGFKFVILQT